MTEGKKDIVAELEDLIRLKQECSRKYQLRKKEVVDFDIRAAYDILQLSSEGDESRLRAVFKNISS